MLTDRIKGPVVPLNICFTEDDDVDFLAMRRYVNWLCEQKVPVLMLTHGSSEYCWLSDEDIWRLTAELAEEIAGRSLFITSTGWWPPKICIKFLRHAEESGADIVKVQVSSWIVSNAGPAKGEVFRTYHDRIQDAAGIPLMLWCNSAGSGAIPVDVIAELAKHPQIVGVKNDEDAFGYYYDLIRATSEEDFAVISGGQMRNFVYGYQVGSPAYLCTVAPFRPDIALAFHHLLLDGNLGDAWQMVFRYEDKWLRAACDMNWLLSIKSAIHLHGLLPNNRPGGMGRPHSTDELEGIRRCLESVFGPTEKVDL